MRSKRLDVLIAVATLLAILAIVIAHATRSRRAKAGSKAIIGRRGSMKRNRLKVALGLVAVAAVASASVGVTMALYSTKATQVNTFASGTVTQTTAGSTACSATQMAPGDTATTCTFAITYAGSISGYMALDVFIATGKNPATGTWTDLYNRSDGANGTQITVTDNSAVSYISGGATPTVLPSSSCSSGSPDGLSYSTGNDNCYLLSNLLVSTSAFSNGGTKTFTTTVTLPAAEPATTQGGIATVVLSVHAVQSAHNTLSCTTTATAGSQCTQNAPFSW
jgi:Camelysin metallo-endopeptidase